VAVLTLAGVSCCCRSGRDQGQWVIRHLGIPYANFVSGSGDGFEVELTRKFAEYLGVKYEYVKADWGTVIQDLTGKIIKLKGSDIEVTGDSQIKGHDRQCFTMLPWREKAVNFFYSHFPQPDLVDRSGRLQGSSDQAQSQYWKRHCSNQSSHEGALGTCSGEDLSWAYAYNLAATGAKVILSKGSWTRWHRPCLKVMPSWPFSMSPMHWLHCRNGPASLR